MKLFAAQVHDLQDTLKVALSNGDMFATTPDRLTKAETNAQNRRTLSEYEQYRTTHADQLKTLRSMSNVESEWFAITRTEQRIATVIDAARTTGQNLVAVPDERDAVIREIAGREEFRMAIAHAEDAGRVTLSESNATLVQQVLDDTPTTIGGTARSIRQGAGAAPVYTPLSQRGFTTAELLAGDLSAGQAFRTAGLLATAADTVRTGQRATQLLGQDNPLAAQSELAHFAGRNVGGWAGGSAAAYALGSSGAGPMVLIAADAYVMTKAGEKAAELLDNRAIYNQTDHDGVHWSFNGTAWSRDGKADTTNDGTYNPTATPIVASYEKARELNYQATNAAAALALRDAPAPQDPYRQPASATDRPSLSTADWQRDASDGQWHRLVKTEITGANDRGSYVQDTATPARAAELDAQAQEVIARNIANSPGAIAARYELAYHRSGWAADGLPMSPAVQQALPDPDALTASNGQRYYRDIEGQWTGHGAPPDANRVLELETTRALLQPALAEQAQMIAAIQQAPPSPQDQQREETLYRYRILGTELKPEWREAIELATQRTRAAEGLVGDGAMQLQRGPGGTFGADSPIAHLQRGADGVERIAAVTSTEDIRQALQEVQARQQPASPAPQLASMSRASDGSAESDTSSSNASAKPQLVMDMQVRMQAASAAQARQERDQQERQAQDQQQAQARAHALQEQTAHADRANAAAAMQAHAALELGRQALQHEEQQERQVLDAQREQSQRQAHDTQQQEQAQQQAQQTQQREQETRQAQDAEQHQAERSQAQETRHQAQPPLHAQEALQREQEPLPGTASREPPQLHAQSTQQHAPEHRPSQDSVAQHAPEPHAERAQSPAFDRAEQQTQNQHAQESRADDTQHVTVQSAAITPAAPEDPQHAADLQATRHPPTSKVEQQLDALGHAHTVQVPNLPPEQSLAAQRGGHPAEALQHSTPPESDTAAALPVPPHLTHAAASSLAAPTIDRSTGTPEDDADAHQSPSVAQSQEQAPSAAAVPDPDSWAEIARSMREMRIRLEQELETEDRIAQARQARVERGQQPYTDLELREGYDPDGPSALRKPPSRVEDAAQGRQAGAHSAGEQDDDRPQPIRKTITGDPDVDDLLYAIDSKNDLAIEQALKRVANSAHSAALAEQGHAHLDAQALQQAEEQAAAQQALGLAVPAEAQTSRGPVMVMTLPQFAHGPAGGPPGGAPGGDG
ncbi:hypothetical protein, partial [Xanthomonas phaseoli]